MKQGILALIFPLLPIASALADPRPTSPELVYESTKGLMGELTADGANLLFTVDDNHKSTYVINRLSLDVPDARVESVVHTSGSAYHLRVVGDQLFWLQRWSIYSASAKGRGKPTRIHTTKSPWTLDAFGKNVFVGAWRDIEKRQATIFRFIPPATSPLQVIKIDAIWSGLRATDDAVFFATEDARLMKISVPSGRVAEVARDFETRPPKTNKFADNDPQMNEIRALQRVPVEVLEILASNTALLWLNSVGTLNLKSLLPPKASRVVTKGLHSLVLCGDNKVVGLTDDLHLMSIALTDDARSEIVARVPADEVVDDLTVGGRYLFWATRRQGGHGGKVWRLDLGCSASN